MTVDAFQRHDKATVDVVPSSSMVAAMLAGDHRRRVFAAVVLGAGNLEGVAGLSGLDSGRAGKALARLASEGLVINSAGGLVVNADGLQRAARTDRSRPPQVEHQHQPDDRRQVLNAFVHDGRIVSIPTAMPKRLVLLEWLAQLFEPGQRYTEAMVNLILGQRYADTAALRRYLVDHQLLDREAGMYWRCGGSVSSGDDG